MSSTVIHRFADPNVAIRLDPADPEGPSAGRAELHFGNHPSRRIVVDEPYRGVAALQPYARAGLASAPSFSFNLALSLSEVRHAKKRLHPY